VHYTCTLRHVVLLPERRVLSSQAIVYSSSNAWRRQASLVWAAMTAASQRPNPLMRLELHPHDADHPAIRRSWQRMLERELDGRGAFTLAAVAQQFRRETDWDSLLSGDAVDAA
jgi:predicted deacetylase